MTIFWAFGIVDVACINIFNDLWKEQVQQHGQYRVSAGPRPQAPRNSNPLGISPRKKSQEALAQLIVEREEFQKALNVHVQRAGTKGKGKTKMAKGKLKNRERARI